MGELAIEVGEGMKGQIGDGDRRPEFLLRAIDDELPAHSIVLWEQNGHHPHGLRRVSGIF
jgi:hypothetical protein